MKNPKLITPKLVVCLAVLVGALALTIGAIASPHSQQSCWCCYKTGSGGLSVSHVIKTSPEDCNKKHGHCYATQAEAKQACSGFGGGKKCWCCYFDPFKKGVVYTTSQQCASLGGTCYDFQSQANAACK